jgi:Holliday junction resolvase RusA-like endonuclease
MNITSEGYQQMQLKVKELADKKKKSNHLSVGGFSKPLGRPDLEKEQLKLSKKSLNDSINEYLEGDIKIMIKPLSVNMAWAGKRFKTPAYKKYEKDVIKLLPKIKLPKAPYKLYLRFGFSNKASDLDNPVKNFVDLLQKSYKFNDKEIYRLLIEKEIVKKGGEYISFKIESINN